MRPLWKVSEIKIGVYFDLNAFVVAVLPRSRENQLDVILTDFTKNELCW